MWKPSLMSAPNIAGTLSISAGLALIPALGLLDDSKFREKCVRAAQATAAKASGHRAPEAPRSQGLGPRTDPRR